MTKRNQTFRTFLFKKNVSASLIGFFLFSCSENDSNQTKLSVDNRTRYTFSQEEMIDFTVASGTYQVVYDYSVPVDTMFTYSGAFIYGKDSLIYTRARRTNGEFEEEFIDSDPNYYHGELTDLIMYNGSSHIKLNPIGFDPYFSAFCVNENVLFYWGSVDNGDLYAYRYELDTKKSKRIRLTEVPGTDFFGYLNPPIVLENGNVVFEIYEGQKWIFDRNFDSVGPTKKVPTFISPNN